MVLIVLPLCIGEVSSTGVNEERFRVTYTHTPCAVYPNVALCQKGKNYDMCLCLVLKSWGRGLESR